MRKKIVRKSEQTDEWLDLEQHADVEVTSEDPEFPVESALIVDAKGDWRAAERGEQTIRLFFDRPRTIRRIRLEFVEVERARTQQFTLSWRSEGAESYREIVRQQWNFSPGGATSEVEDLRVDLPNVSAIELTIQPEIGGGDARASLRALRLA